MKCTCCGKELTCDDRYCPSCGQNNPNFIEPHKPDPIEEAPRTNYQSPSPSYSNNSYNQQNYHNNSYYQQKTSYSPPESKSTAVFALIFSILGGWLGLVFAIIGLSTYKEQGNRSMCKAALIIFISEVAFFIILYAIILS